LTNNTYWWINLLGSCNLSFGSMVTYNAASNCTDIAIGDFNNDSQIDPLVNKCIESMIVKINEMNGSEFNIYSLYKRLTMDVICKYDNSQTKDSFHLRFEWLQLSRVCWSYEGESCLQRHFLAELQVSDGV
jgi:hypothetical protein